MSTTVFMWFCGVWLVISILLGLFVGLFVRTGKGPDNRRYDD